MKKRVLFLAVLFPLFLNAQKIQKDSATAYINANIRNSPTAPLRASIINAALNKVQRGVIDSLYGLSGSLVALQNGSTRTVYTPPVTGIRNGLSLSSGLVGLGGSLEQNTTVNGGNTYSTNFLNQTQFNVTTATAGSALLQTGNFRYLYIQNPGAVLSHDKGFLQIGQTDNGIRLSSRGLSTGTLYKTFFEIDSAGYSGSPVRKNSLLTVDSLTGEATWLSPQAVANAVQPFITGGSGGGLTTADNGLSVISGNVGLGQPLGQAGNPAALAGDREIPTGGNSLFFRNGNTYTQFKAGQLVFNDSSTVASSSTGTFENTSIVFNPLRKGVSGKKYAFHQTSNKTLTTSATYNEIWKQGHNINAGGSIENPAVGFAMWDSWESRYDPDGDDGTHWGEKIFAYQDTSAVSQQVRLEMWTIKPRPLRKGPDATLFFSANRIFFKNPEDVNATYGGFAFTDSTVGQMTLTGKVTGGYETYLTGPSAENIYSIGPASGRKSLLFFGAFQNVQLGNTSQFLYEGADNWVKYLRAYETFDVAGTQTGWKVGINYGSSTAIKGGLHADFNTGAIKLASVSGYYTEISSGDVTIARFGQGGVAFGVSPSAPAATAIVDMQSTNRGFLPPRMTKTQRDAIASPAAGLCVYQTDNTPGLRVYNGTNWMRYTETAD